MCACVCVRVCVLQGDEHKIEDEHFFCISVIHIKIFQPFQHKKNNLATNHNHFFFIKLKSKNMIWVFAVQYSFQWKSLFRSQSYQALFFFVFQFSLLSLSVCSRWKRCIYDWMVKLNCKNRKIMHLQRKQFW